MTACTNRFPASSPEAAYDACHPEEALAHDDSRYVDLTSIRGGENLAHSIAWRIRNTPPPRFHQQLVTGHRGCGKSTELLQLGSRLVEAGYCAIYLDVESVLDPSEVTCADVLLAIAKGVEEDLRVAGTPVDPALLDEIATWFAKTVLTKEQREDVESTISASAEVGARIPFFAKLLTAISGRIRDGSSTRRVIRQTLEAELSSLIAKVNHLLDAARSIIHDTSRSDIVVLVDGLEKMHYRQLAVGVSSHSDLFVNHAEQLKSPHCHAVYAAPVSLMFDTHLGDVFPDPVFLLPMVDVAKEAGCDRFLEVIRRRVVVECVFEEESLAQELIHMSGGALRDLMRLIRKACVNASPRISAMHVESAIAMMIQEYDRLLREEDLDHLVWIASHKRVRGDDRSARLLHDRLVHEYQGEERWADLHPALYRNGRLRDKLGRR